MKATEILHDRGQSLWLDNITRSMLDDGAIQRYIDSYSVTGLTSNPFIFDKASGSGDYDDAIRVKSGQGLSHEDLFFELAIEDLPNHRQTSELNRREVINIGKIRGENAAQSGDPPKRGYSRRSCRTPFLLSLDYGLRREGKGCLACRTWCNRTSDT